MDNPLRYKKTKLGHMIDARKAMSELSETAKQWCCAFDAGDFTALGDLSVDFGDCVQSFADATRASAEAPE